MQVQIELCLIPLGVGISLSPYIARCQEVFLAAGLEPQLHAYGTNVEGDWDAVLTAVKSCHEAVHALGAARIHSSLKLGTRIDRAQSLDQKTNSVKARMNG